MEWARALIQRAMLSSATDPTTGVECTRLALIHVDPSLIAGCIDMDLIATGVSTSSRDRWVQLSRQVRVMRQMLTTFLNVEPIFRSAVG